MDHGKTHFEDFAVGDAFAHGAHRVTREEILEFARKYDPQPFHVDDELAAKSIYGGLTSSGVMTMAIMLKLIVEHFPGAATQGSPGWDEVRWLKPVRPGDTLSIKGECVEGRPLRSRPELGVLKFRWEVLNQAGEVVATAIAGWLIERRRTAVA